VQIGRLHLPSPAGPYLVRKLAENRIETLPITLDHALGIESLPMYHRDPFDRILVAQSLEEDLSIITSDPLFQQYPVKLIW
jgi:PIN domain nuclease of toxin-antitoxin system